MTTAAACLSGHEDRVWCVRWHPSGSMLASCSSDKSIRMWHRQDDDWKSCAVLPEAHQRTVRSLAWSPCGNILASSSFDATVNIWDKKSGDWECSATLEGHENEVKSVAWSASGRVLATCSRDKSVWVWEVGDDDEYECASVLPSHSQDVKRVAFHPHAEILASASYDDTLKVYREDDDDWVVSATLSGHTSTVWCLAFNEDGNYIASGSDDKALRIWRQYLPGNAEGIATEDNEPAWKCVCTLSGHHDRTIYDVAWCHLTSTIATAAGDDTIRLFRQQQGSDHNAPRFDLILTIPNAHSEDVNSVAWNPKQPGMLASASDDSTIKIWDFSSLL